MKILKLAPFLIFIFVLVSCSQAATPVSVPTKLPNPTSTFVPTATLTITPSPVIYPTQVYGLLTSPDGTKKVQSNTYEGKTFDVIESSGKVLWSFTYDATKFGPDHTDILVEAGYSPFYWSKDGKYIYITSYHGQEIDTSTKFFGNEFIDGCGVVRLNIDTGEMEEILPETTPGHGYYAFSISPDEKYLVYTYQAEVLVKIKLLDLDTREEHVLLTAEEDVLETGRYGWSPKGDKIVFMTLKMSEDEKRFYSIWILDLKGLETKLLVKDFENRIRFLSWAEQDVISYDPDDGGSIWQLQTDSETFSIVTVTPWATLSLPATPTP